MIPSERAHLKVVAKSHPGMTGKNNEDRYAVSAYRTSKRGSTPVLLAVLCDGIGGHRSGEVAAEMAVDSISSHIAGSGGETPLETLGEAIQAASQRIYQAAQADANHAGMGATCACAWVIGSRLYTAAVGDSRIYLLRGGEIIQLTTDHTWIQEALDKGVITPEQAAGHPNAHVIRRYLGSPNPPAPDFRLRLDPQEGDRQASANQGMAMQPGDLLLLCSDGLTDLVGAQEIATTLADAPLEDATQKLVDLANSRGGHDNITLVALSAPRRFPRGAGTAQAAPVSGARRAFAGCLGMVTLALLAIVAYMAYLYWSGQPLPVVGGEPTATQTVTPAATTAASTRTSLPPATLPPSATACPAGGCATRTPVPALPTTSGATITPWPTHTLGP